MPSNVGLGALAATLAVIAAACSAPNGSAGSSTTETPPFPIGQVGTPVHVKESSRATADITLNSATWFPPGCAGGFACNVVELTITSAQPFNYKEIYVVAGNGGGDQPFTHPQRRTLARRVLRRGLPEDQ